MRTDEVEKYYRRHAWLYNWTRPFFLFDRKKAIVKLDVTPGNIVLDVGCGTGLNVPYLVNKGAKVIGVDCSSAMLARARKKYPSVEFIQADVTSFVYSEHIDAAIATYVLSMVDEWEKAIVCIKQMLKPGAKLVILDFHPWQGWLRPLYPLFRRWLHTHGVDPEKNYVSFLKEHFQHVDVEINKCGYDYIIVAERRKE